MRISEAAAVAGVTARGIRHYHQIGVLAEPQRLGNGYRDYQLADVIRLMRVRWLVAAGVPLRAVPGQLDGGSAEDLTALIETIDAERARLAAQRASLVAMRDGAGDDGAGEDGTGGRTSPLPAALARAMDELLALADDADVRAMLTLERDGMEMLALSGAAPEGLFETWSAAIGDDAHRHRLLGHYRRIADLKGKAVGDNGDEINSLARDLAGSDMLALLAGNVASAGPGPNPMLDELVPDAAQREVVRQAIALLGGTS